MPSMLHPRIDPSARALIFDCDGTLADSMHLHWQAWHSTFAFYDTSCPQDFLDIRAGMPTDLIVAQFNQHFSQTLALAEFVARKEETAFSLLDQVKPIEPVVSIAHAAYAHLPMAVVSGGNRADVEKTLSRLKILQLFSVVITADDGLPPKPSPQIFLEAARLLGDIPASHCQVYEDAPPGLHGARDAGMIVSDVRGFSGYPGGE
jgi:HAD superfamily hydrolase (TIGR01509 family)